MNEILPVTSLVQALSISCLKGSNTFFLFFNLVYWWAFLFQSINIPGVQMHPCSCTEPPRSPSHALQSSAWHRWPWSLPLLAPISASCSHRKPLAILPTNHVLLVVWAQTIPGMPLTSFSTLNAFFPFRLIWNMTSSLNLSKTPQSFGRTSRLNSSPHQHIPPGTTVSRDHCHLFRGPWHTVDAPFMCYWCLSFSTCPIPNSRTPHQRIQFRKMGLSKSHTRKRTQTGLKEKTLAGGL